MNNNISTKQPKKYIAYYRVSTDKQGISGLGLEAQQSEVKNFINTDDEIISEYIEIESSRKNRPQLSHALEQCRNHKATLIIAKLDRLARNVHFISGLLESNIDFVAVDNPHANKLMLHMLSAFAEHERDMISERTKQALDQAKERGVELGKNGKKLAMVNHNKATQFAFGVYDRIKEIKQSRLTTLQQITDELNRLNIPTFHDKGQWHISSTRNVIKRAEQVLG